MKITRGVESISQMQLHTAQQTPALLSQTPASSKVKVQSRQKKPNITMPVSCLLLITYYGAKPPSHHSKKKISIYTYASVSISA